MSTIEALDNLRGWADVSWEPWAESRERLHKMLDEIEAEIEERYMPLPVDVNNEPVHIGDEMEHRSKHETLDVVAVGNDRFFTGRWADDYVCCVEVSAQWHHVKPRTLEDVLTEMLDRNTDGVGLREFNRDFGAFVAHYAEEIRELMGADDD